MSYNLGSARGVISMEYNGRGVAQAKTDVKGLGTETTAAGKAIDGGKKLLSQYAIGAAAVAAGLASATRTVAEFEAGLSGIKAVSGATADEMDSIRAKALQLGADTSFSASEAAAAMEELIKAGLSVDDVLNGAADAAVALAAAGGVSIPEAATIAANAMNQFNLTAAEMSGVVDQIAGAANASAIDVSDLGQSLKQVGAVANLAGLSFEDTATAIAQMGNAGIVGSDAGTSLKSMLQRLQPTTVKQTELFAELGLSAEDGSNKFFDAEGNLKSYAQIAGVLSGALEGQTNQQKLLNLQTLFGADAIRAAAIAADSGAKGVREMNAEMNKTTAAEVAATRLDNFSGSLEALGGSIETAIISGGSGLLVFLRDVVDGLTLAVNKGVELGGALAGELAPGFNSVVQVIKNVVSLALDVADVFDGAVLAAGKLTLTVAIGAFTVLARVLEIVTGLLADQGPAIAIVAGAWLILANGGLAAVIARLGWFATLGLVKVLQGLGAMQAGAATTATAMSGLAASAAAAAAALGAVALLVAAVMVWNAYKEAVEETQAALDSAAEAKSTGNFTGLQDEIDAINKLIADRKAAIEEYGSTTDGFEPGTFLNNAFNPTRWGDVAKLEEFGDSMGALEATSRDLGSTLQGMGEGITGLATQFDLLDPAAAAELVAAFSEGDPDALLEMESLLGEMQPLLDQAGISAEQFMGALKGTGDMSLGEVEAALNRVTGKAGTAATATQSLADAAEDFSSKAADAAEKAAGLEDALDSLIGVELSAAEASIQWREGLRELTAGIKENGNSLRGNSAEADANRTLIINSTKDILDRVAAEAKAGTSLGKITNMFKANRAELLNNAEAAGLNRKEVDNLLRSYNFTPDAVRTLVEAVGAQKTNDEIQRLIKKYELTPEEVTTLFEAQGAETASEQIKVLRQYIAGLKGKDVDIGTPGAEQSTTSIKELREQIRVLEGKDAKIGTPGAQESEAEIRRLREQIALLRDREITITTTVRRVVENVASGIGGMFSGGGGGGSRTSGGNERSISDGMFPRSSSDLPAGGLTPFSSAPRAAQSQKLSGLAITGALTLKDSGAYISGFAEDADDADDDYEDTIRRMG